ncbi:MAG: GAF domain-containing SpoIIE family protein phosphatase [Pseudonocardiaceae bacterium]
MPRYFYNQAIDGIATGEGVGSCGTAAHRRQPVIVADIATDPFWDDFRTLADRADLAACWSTPILASDGELLGTFAMYYRTPRAPQETDLALSAVFARTAALAIERHRIQQARAAAEVREKTARRDLAFVLEASTVIARELDYDAGLQHLARLAVPTLAPLCAIDVFQDGWLRRIATAAADETHQQLLACSTPLHPRDEVIARVLASGVTEIARRPPSSLGPWHELGVTSHLCVPLSARGRTFGTMSLLTANDRSLDGHAVALAGELARRAAVNADNARQYTERARLARDLQAGLLIAELPALPGLTVATYYQPVGDGLQVGGDFYDVFPLAPDRWVFMIGDVCGHGALAATTTGLVRHTARAAARLVKDPTAVVEAINTALLERSSQHGTGFVTLLYGHLQHTHGTVTIELVRAGHVPPLLRRADGRVEELETPGKLLGIGSDLHLRTRHLYLDPGDSLVMVTDGIIEARSATRELFGEQRLLHSLSTADTKLRADAQSVLDAVVHAVDDHTARETLTAEDDRAALVFTATEQPGTTRQSNQASTS